MRLFYLNSLRGVKERKAMNEIESIPTFYCGHAKTRENTYHTGKQIRCRVCQVARSRAIHHNLGFSIYLQHMYILTEIRDAIKREVFNCGHPRSEENTYRSGKVKRCRICTKADSIKRYYTKLERLRDGKKDI